MTLAPLLSLSEVLMTSLVLVGIYSCLDEINYYYSCCIGVKTEEQLTEMFHQIIVVIVH
jgi:hypothetical protein